MLNKSVMGHISSQYALSIAIFYGKTIIIVVFLPKKEYS